MLDKLIVVIDGLGNSSEIALRWILLNMADYKPTLVQVKVPCRQPLTTWANGDPNLCHHVASLGLNDFYNEHNHGHQNLLSTNFRNWLNKETFLTHNIKGTSCVD